MLDTLLSSQNISILCHLGFSMLAGGLSGLERSYYGRPAGFRKHTLAYLAPSVLMA